MVGAELSTPIAKYLSVSIVWSCRGPLRLLTSAPHLRFAFRKPSAAVTLVGRLKCSDYPSSSHPPPSTLLVFVPLLGYSYTHPPLSTPAAGTLLLLSRGRSLVAIQKPGSVTPVLLAVTNAALAHPPVTPYQSRLHTPSYPAIGHRFVPRHRSGVQVHTLTS